MTQSLLQKFSVTGIYSRNQKQKHSFHCKLPAVFLQISYLIFRTFSVYITTTSLQISATTPSASSGIMPGCGAGSMCRAAVSSKNQLRFLDHRSHTVRCMGIYICLFCLYICRRRYDMVLCCNGAGFYRHAVLTYPCKRLKH